MSRPFHKQAVRFPLKQLFAEAAKYADFESFERAYLHEIKHGQYWHVTQDPDFVIDPERGPRDMSSMASGSMTPGALMITSHLKLWADYYDRPYAAEIDMSKVPEHLYRQVDRGFGNEFFVRPEGARLAQVTGVYTVKSALRRDREYHSKLPNSDQELAELYYKVQEIL